MKNEKAFTLVELLVTMVVLGIITGISIPLIRNIQTNNENKQYTTYASTLLESAKLYNNSYEEDLFGHHDSGCAYVTYDQLVEKDLLKDIPLPDVSCNSDSTFVKIVKLDNQYSYSYYLGCGEKTDEKVSEVVISLPEANKVYSMDSEICSGISGPNIVVSASPMDGTIKRRKKTHILLESVTGINNGVVLFAAWRQDKNYEAVTDWQKVEIPLPGGQKKKILNGNDIVASSEELVTPSGGNGEYYLLVRIERLEDLYGSKWKNPENAESEYLSFGPFKVDNIPPTCTNSGDSTTWAKESRTIKWGCKDEYSGCSTSDSSKTFSSTTKTSIIASYTIKDKAGNSTTCPERTANVYVDRTAPTCTNSGDSTTWINGDRTIKWGCKDTDSGCVTADGSKKFTNNIKTSEIASYTIKDKAGNTTTCPKRTANIYIDKAPPTITVKKNPLTLGDKNYTFSDNVTLKWGISGTGTITCNPSTTKKKGNYNVSCYATSVTKVKSSSVSFAVKHSYEATRRTYAATAHTSTYDCNCYYCGYTCHRDWGTSCSGCENCGGHYVWSGSCCNKCSSTSYSCDGAKNADGSNATLDGTTCIYYTCPNGGTLTLSTHICNY